MLTTKFIHKRYFSHPIENFLNFVPCTEKKRGCIYIHTYSSFTLFYFLHQLIPSHPHIFILINYVIQDFDKKKSNYLVKLKTIYNTARTYNTQIIINTKNIFIHKFHVQNDNRLTQVVDFFNITQKIQKKNS